MPLRLFATELKDQKVIVTTDDFGPYPAINKGVIELVKAGKVNSVNVLINYDGHEQYKSSAENVKELLEAGREAEAKFDNYTLEIGAHLTITSGQPMAIRGSSDEHLVKVLVDDNYNFHDYVNMRRADSDKRLAMRSLIKKEIEAQYNALKSALGDEKKVSYLNSHHDALFMWPEYSSALFEFATEDNRNLPIRSAVIFPRIRDNFYKKQISIRSLNSIYPQDIRDYKKHQKMLAVEMLDMNIKTPEYLDSRHYGPIPGQPFDHRTRVNKKQIGLSKATRFLSKFSRNAVAEILLHVAHNDPNLLMPDICYSGVNPKYIEGRKAEYESLMNLPDNIMPPFGSWSSL